MIVAAAVLLVLAIAAFLAGEAKWNFRWWAVAAVLAVAAVVLVFAGAFLQLLN